MAGEELRKRPLAQSIPAPIPDLGAGTAGRASDHHPAGRVKHGPLLQIARLLLLITWFWGVCSTTITNQVLGCPLYFISKDWYYAYMAVTKQAFGVLMISITQWFSPSTMRVSWEPSLTGQFKLGPTGLLETSLPERLVLISNHQIYTDWLFLWWFSYTSRMHGHIYIILKESLKYIPILGQGMQFYGFIFMARKWTSDKPRLAHRLQKLKTRHDGPLSGSKGLNPMWLLIFPEGTNLSGNTRKRSAKWAESQGIDDMKYQVLPRSTGLQFCVDELKDTIEWIYDCTIGYDGVPPGGYAQDIYTLRSTYIQGRPPKSVNMYWRRFAIKDIPVSDPKAFEQWISDRWREKDELLEQFYQTGRFPSGTQGAEIIGQQQADLKKPSRPSNVTAGVGTLTQDGYLETKVEYRSWLDVAQIFLLLASYGLIANVIVKAYEMFF